VAGAAVEVVPESPKLTAEEAAALFSEVESLRRRVIELQEDNVRLQNAHAILLAEREYWFTKWSVIYDEQQRNK
jgi:hypothetical protein